MTIYYCIEDELSRAVAERLIDDYCPSGTIATELGQAHGGFGYIKKNLRKFRDLSLRCPVLILVDLDRGLCAPSLRSSWLTSENILEPLPAGMIFCIAQTEIESWLLADTDGISSFLKVSPAKFRHNIEMSVVDCKEYLVELAKGSPNTEVRNDLSPSPKSMAATGINYNFKLSQFVVDVWDPQRAAENSLSLKRAISKLSALVF